MAIELGSAYGKIALDIGGFTKGLSQATVGINKFVEKAKAIGGSMQKIGGAMTLGLTLPIVGFLKASVDSAMQAESALTELNAVLTSTGGAAGLTADELTKMASELQKVTKFSDDEIVLGQSMLLTFTKIGKDVFPATTEAMLNMAEKFGGVDQAAIQLGKALNDPIAGVGALRRVGVALTEEQENQIKGFMAVNDIASAQKIILKELEVEFGGLARAAGETTAGKMAQLTNAFDDLREVVGGAIIPMLLPLVKSLTKMAEAFTALPPFVQKGVVVLLALAAVAGPLIALVGTVVSAVGTITGFVGSLSALGITLPVVSAGIASVGATITATLLPAIGAVLVALAPILAILAGLLLVVGIVYLAWKYNFLGMRDNINALVARVKVIGEAFTKFMDAIRNTGYQFTVLFEDGSGALHDLAVAFGFPAKAAQDFLAKVWLIFDRFRDGIAKAREFLVNAFTKADWGQIGKSITLGIANGMLLGIPGLVLAAAKAAEAALAQIKKSLGISSPSKKAFELGASTAQGYMLGLRTMDPNAIANMMARPITNSSSQQQIINNHFSNGLTLRDVKNVVDANNEALINTMLQSLGGA